MYALEQAVLSSPGQPLTPQQAQKADSIDKLRTQARLSAEKKCRKLRTGKVEYSPDTMAPGKELCFWQAALARKQGAKVHSLLWQSLKKAAKVTTPTKDLTFDDINQFIKSASDWYREAKKQAPTNRETYLDTLPPKIRTRYLRVEAQCWQG